MYHLFMDTKKRFSNEWASLENRVSGGSGRVGGMVGADRVFKARQRRANVVKMHVVDSNQSLGIPFQSGQRHLVKSS